MSNQLKQESHSSKCFRSGIIYFMFDLLASRSALITITDDFDLSDIETTYVT